MSWAGGQRRFACSGAGISGGSAQCVIGLDGLALDRGEDWPGSGPEHNPLAGRVWIFDAGAVLSLRARGFYLPQDLLVAGRIEAERTEWGRLRVDRQSGDGAGAGFSERRVCAGQTQEIFSGEDRQNGGELAAGEAAVRLVWRVGCFGGVHWMEVVRHGDGESRAQLTGMAAAFHNTIFGLSISSHLRLNVNEGAKE